MEFLNRKFGTFILLRPLGLGAMAQVYLGIRQCGLNAHRFVALKCILAPYNDVGAYIQMFYHEADVGLRLRHPNLIATTDCCMIDGRHTLVMDYIPGMTLGAYLKHADHITPESAAWFGLCALEGLSYLHGLCDESGMPLNIVHRDISPDNIQIGYDGSCRVFDFGVCQTANATDTNQTGMMVGKYRYMSPEQCKGLSTDCRSDIFALAAVLYEASLGMPLFERDSDIRTIDAVMNAKIAPPNTVMRDYPVFLSQAVMRGLARDPSVRYQTAGEFAEDLRNFLKMRGILHPQALAGSEIAKTCPGQSEKAHAELVQYLNLTQSECASLTRLLANSKHACDIDSTLAPNDIFISKDMPS